MVEQDPNKKSEQKQPQGPQQSEQGVDVYGPMLSLMKEMQQEDAMKHNEQLMQLLETHQENTYLKEAINKLNNITMGAETQTQLADLFASDGITPSEQELIDQFEDMDFDSFKDFIAFNKKVEDITEPKVKQADTLTKGGGLLTALGLMFAAPPLVIGGMMGFAEGRKRREGVDRERELLAGKQFEWMRDKQKEKGSNIRALLQADTSRDVAQTNLAGTQYTADVGMNRTTLEQTVEREKLAARQEEIRTGRKFEETQRHLDRKNSLEVARIANSPSSKDRLEKNVLESQYASAISASATEFINVASTDENLQEDFSDLVAGYSQNKQIDEAKLATFVEKHGGIIKNIIIPNITDTEKYSASGINDSNETIADIIKKSIERTSYFNKDNVPSKQGGIRDLVANIEGKKAEIQQVNAVDKAINIMNGKQLPVGQYSTLVKPEEDNVKFQTISNALNAQGLEVSDYRNVNDQDKINTIKKALIDYVGMDLKLLAAYPVRGQLGPAITSFLYEEGVKTPRGFYTSATGFYTGHWRETLYKENPEDVNWTKMTPEQVVDHILNDYEEQNPNLNYEAFMKLMVVLDRASSAYKTPMQQEDTNLPLINTMGK